MRYLHDFTEEMDQRVREAKERAVLTCNSEWAAKVAALDAKHAAEKLAMSETVNRLRAKLEADHRKEFKAVQAQLQRCISLANTITIS